MKGMLGHYQEVTRSATATLLLHEIACWTPKANATHGGHTWIAKSAKDWCAETGLTMHQYDNAARKLRKLRLIITEQHIFDLESGKAITYLRLTHQGQALVDKATGA